MKKYFLILSVIFFSFLAYLSIWGVIVVGDIEFEKIVFHMLIPLKGAHTKWVVGLWIPFMGTFLTGIIAFVVCRVLKKVWIVFGFLAFFIIFDCLYINSHFKVYDFFRSQIASSNFIEQHYVVPQFLNITFPDKKKNLIIVMVESLETSYQDYENGGLLPNNYIPELTKLAKENISFSTSDKIEGAFVAPETGWTIAATVAQTAGIPLKLYDSIDNGNQERFIDNKMGAFKYFLPGAITLGDILAYNGYKNYFILGTGAQYAGKSDYLKQHGNYKIMDRYYFKSRKTMKDKELFDTAKSEILKISERQPFSVLIQTIDTHFGRKEQYKILSKNVDSFIQWLRKQSFYKDTVILVVGDHCNMGGQRDFKNLENDNFRYNGNLKRKVYNTFINPVVFPKKMTYRKFSTIDMFPTILASMGAKIKNDRLGLGTNLFSEEQTLMEKYEPEWVFQELKKRSNWYNHNLLSKGLF